MVEFLRFYLTIRFSSIETKSKKRHVTVTKKRTDRKIRRRGRGREREGGIGNE
jgi:hypothetical protein